MVAIARLLVPVALLGLGTLYFHEAGTIRVLYDTGPIGPGDFPKALFVALVVAVAFVLVGEFRARGRAEKVVIAPADLAVVGAVLAICAVYVVLFQRIGFLVSTFLLALALLVAFSRGRMGILLAALYAVLITGAVFGLFGLVFNVRLPPTPFLDAVLAWLSRP